MHDFEVHNLAFLLAGKLARWMWRGQAGINLPRGVRVRELVQEGQREKGRWDAVLKYRMWVWSLKLWVSDYYSTPYPAVPTINTNARIRVTGKERRDGPGTDYEKTSAIDIADPVSSSDIPRCFWLPVSIASLAPGSERVMACVGTTERLFLKLFCNCCLYWVVDTMLLITLRAGVYMPA